MFRLKQKQQTPEQTVDFNSDYKKLSKILGNKISEAKAMYGEITKKIGFELYPNNSGYIIFVSRGEF